MEKDLNQLLSDAMADSIERLSEKAVVFQNDIIEKAIDGAPGVFDGFGPLIDADIKAGVLKREGFTDRPFNLQDYVQETASVLGRKILSDYKEYLPYFKKIVPRDYQRMLTAISRHEEQGMPHDKAVLEAFREISAG